MGGVQDPTPEPAILRDVAGMPDGDFVGVQALPGRVSKFALDGTPDLAWGHRVFRSLAIPNTYLRDSVEGVGVINPDPGHVIGVEAGNQHTCALVAYHDAEPNQAWCWGSNNAGQLGQPAFGEVSTSLSVQSSLGVDPQVLAAGGDQTCAVSQGGGQPTCFGDVSSRGGDAPRRPRTCAAGPPGHGLGDTRVVGRRRVHVWARVGRRCIAREVLGWERRRPARRGREPPMSRRRGGVRRAPELCRGSRWQDAAGPTSRTGLGWIGSMPAC